MYVHFYQCVSKILLHKINHTGIKKYLQSRHTPRPPLTPPSKQTMTDKNPAEPDTIHKESSTRKLVADQSNSKKRRSSEDTADMGSAAASSARKRLQTSCTSSSSSSTEKIKADKQTKNDAAAAKCAFKVKWCVLLVQCCSFWIRILHWIQSLHLVEL
jgi:hypothetical protein